MGWNFRKYNGKLLIKPAKEAYHSIINKIRELIKKNNTAKQNTLIKILNPVIRGGVIIITVPVLKQVIKN